MTDEKQPTLEELASEFKVEQSPPAQREPEPQLPSDPEELARWSAKQVLETSRRVEQVSRKLEADEQEKFINSQMSALEKAVDTLGKDVPLSKMLIEGALHTKYARDPNFKKIFDNREQNPNAYQKALGVLSEEIKREAAIKFDPEVAENKRALDQLQRASRTPAKEDPNAKWKNMPQGDFEREWERLRRG